MNDSPPLKFDHCVGKRSDEYRLCAFTDSYKQMYSCALYLVNITTGKMSFLMDTNKLVSKQLQTKSVPFLELQGVTLVVETLIDTHKELTGPSCVSPIQLVELTLHSCSLVF